MTTASDIVAGVVVLGLITVCVGCACALIIVVTVRMIKRGRRSRP